MLSFFRGFMYSSRIMLWLFAVCLSKTDGVLERIKQFVVLGYAVRSLGSTHHVRRHWRCVHPYVWVDKEMTKLGFNSVLRIVHNLSVEAKLV